MTSFYAGSIRKENSFQLNVGEHMVLIMGNRSQLTRGETFLSQVVFKVLLILGMGILLNRMVVMMFF